MLAKQFGKRLKALREQRFLSQRELAEGIKAEPTHISRYERGLFLPNAETLIGLARFLRVSLGTLLLGQDEPAGGGDQPIEDITLLERFRELEKLERKDREIVIALIDAWVRSRQVEEIIGRRKSA
jgi:transcriptional regulator with XRE-family HTH domain